MTDPGTRPSVAGGEAGAAGNGEPGGEAAARAFAARRHGVAIGGDFVDPGGDRIDVENPATEEPLAKVPRAGEATVDQAVRAARAAFDGGAWSRGGPVVPEEVV
jgi:hypothetical protein